MSEPRVLRPVLIRLLEGRVGSTLLMQLLGTAPEVIFDRVYPYENSYLTYLNRLVGRIAAPRQAGADMVQFLYGADDRVGALPFQPEHLDCAALARESLHGVWQSFSHAAQVAASNRGHLYAEKYWGDVMPVIAAGLDPIVVDLIRDPRDVVASVRAFNAKRGRELFGRALARDDRQHLRRMLVGMSLRLNEFAIPLPVTHLLVRYEDLVGDLPGVAARLANVLDVSLDVDVVNQGRSELAHHMTSASAQSSVTRWVGDLSSDDTAAVERALGQQMTGLGYALSTDQGHPSR